MLIEYTHKIVLVAVQWSAIKLKEVIPTRLKVADVFNVKIVILVEIVQT